MLLKKTKKIMSIVLSMLFMVSILPAIPVFADYEGSCGEGVYYSFDQSTGTLTISGNGEMSNYGLWKKTPWNSYKNSIKNLEITNLVKSIGNCAFKDCIGLTSVTIEPIEHLAFYGEEGLNSLFTSTGVKNIGNRGVSDRVSN